MKKNIILVVLFLFILIFTLFLLIDHHEYNLVYNLWKIGLFRNELKNNTKYLTVDAKLINNLKGKTKTEILKWYPDLRVEQHPEIYLDRGNPFYINSSDFLWIADTQWVIEFENEKVIDITLIKGIPKIENRKKIVVH